MWNKNNLAFVVILLLLILSLNLLGQSKISMLFSDYEQNHRSNMVSTIAPTNLATEKSEPTIMNGGIEVTVPEVATTSTLTTHVPSIEEEVNEEPKKVELAIIVWNDNHQKLNYSVESNNKIILADKNGNQLTSFNTNPSLGVGPVAWSPSGKMIAGQCDDVYICFFDTSVLPTKKQYPFYSSPIHIPKNKILFPEECPQTVRYDGEISKIHLFSISFSPDQKQIAIVCGGFHGYQVKGIPCILYIDGGYRCWEIKFANEIFDLEWSPTDDDKLLGTVVNDDPNLADYERNQIYIFNEVADEYKFVDFGQGATWGPDGKDIYYYRQEMPNEKSGIRKISLVDGDSEVIFENPADNIRFLTFDCHFLTYICHLSVSADGKSLAFVTPTSMGAFLPEAYRIDIESKKVEMIVDRKIIEWVYEVKWKPR